MIIIFDKMIISPGIFSVFENFDFPGHQGGKRAKNNQNDKKVTHVK